MKQLIRSHKGLTLIEIMVVIAIITAMATLVLPRISNPNTKMKKAIRRFVVLGRELNNSAKLKGATYRLVLNMGQNSKKQPHKYWVEKAPGQNLLENPDDQRRRLREDKEKSPTAFQRNNEHLKGVQKLPDGLYFANVEKKGLQKPVESGKAYIYFLPSGLVEEAVIHLSYQDEMHWSVAFHPLTGQVDIATSHIALEEIRQR